MAPTLYPKDKDITKTWFIKYTDPATGKLCKVYGQLNHLPTVQEREAEAQRIISVQLQWKPAQEVTDPYEIPALLEQFFDYRKTGLRKKSIMSYEIMVEDFCKWYRLQWKNGDVAVMGLEYLRYLHNKGLSPTTRNAYRSLLSSLFKKIVKAGKLPASPFDNTQKARERRQTKEWFRAEQIEQLKAHIVKEDPQLWLACRLIFYCFIRPGNELRHLQVKDIDMAQMRIRIKAMHSKSGDRDEWVMIPEALVAELGDLTRYPAHYYIFTLEGKPGHCHMGEHQLYRVHSRILKHLQYPKGFTLYSWKNTGAIHMLQNGINLVYISKMMRHKSFDYTREYFKSLGFDDIGMDVARLMPSI